MLEIIQGIGRELLAAFERTDRSVIALWAYLIGCFMAFMAARDWYTSPIVEDDETPADAGTSSTGQRKTTKAIIPHTNAARNRQHDSGRAAD